MKHFKLLTLLLSAFFIACSDDSDIKTIAGEEFIDTPELLLASFSPDSALREISSGLICNITFNNDKRLCTIDFNNTSLPGRPPHQFLRFPDVEWDFTIGTPTICRHIENQNIESESDFGYVVTLLNLSLTSYEPNDLDTYSCHGFIMDFALADGTVCVAIPKSLYCQGTTITGQKLRTNNNTTYIPSLSVDFSPTLPPTANLTFNRLDIISDSLPHTITQQNIPVTLTPKGYSFEVPTIKINSTTAINGFYGEAEFGAPLFTRFDITTSGQTISVSQQLHSARYSTPVIQTVK